MEELLVDNPIDVGPNARALDVLVAIYRSPRMPLHTRMRAAIAALPFETPKLQATAIVPMGLDLKSKLERAIMRSNAVRLLPAQPEAEPAQSFKRRF